MNNTLAREIATEARRGYPALPADMDVCARYSVRASLNWSDGERRYHIWLNNDGTPQDDVIHSNPVVRDTHARRDEHRALSQSAKKWSPLVSAMLAAVVSGDMISKARATEADRQRLEDEKRADDIQLQTVASLALSAHAHLPPDVRKALMRLPNDVLAAFALAIGRG